MRNTDLTIHSDRELELWIDNDEYLNSVWRKSIRTGNINYVRAALDPFKYTNAQWDHLVECFEEELKEEEEALEYRCSILR
jgi:hypothetical protein